MINPERMKNLKYPVCGQDMACKYMGLVDDGRYKTIYRCKDARHIFQEDGATKEEIEGREVKG